MNKFRAEYQVIPRSALEEAEAQFDELMQDYDFNNPEVKGAKRDHEISIRLSRSMANCAAILNMSGRTVEVAAMKCTSIGEDGIEEVPEAIFRGNLGAHIPTRRTENELLLGISTVKYGIALSVNPDIHFFSDDAPADHLSVVTDFSEIDDLRLLRR